eukprot:m.1645127 g.1645127  ORF g.1645127 m.1645127 type:complete len:391 (+) comp65875_c0_seq1:129-1301(+)
MHSSDQLAILSFEIQVDNKMTCREYNASGANLQPGDLLPFGDQGVILLGGLVAVALCALQLSVYLIHVFRMGGLTADPREAHSAVNTKGNEEREASSCCESCFVSTAADAKDTRKNHYTIAGNLFSEDLSVSATMSEYSTNTMRGNQTLLAVSLSTAIALSLLLGFNRLLLTRKVSDYETSVHYVICCAYLSLALVGIFPSCTIHADPTDATRRRRDYNMILCCGCKALTTSGVLHVVCSLIYLFIPVIVKLHTNRDAGERCYADRGTYIRMLQAALVVNIFFVTLVILRPQGLPCSGFSKCFKWTSERTFCKTKCTWWESCFDRLHECWDPNPTGDTNSRYRRKVCFMFTYCMEMVAFAVTTFVYFYIEVNTFFTYKHGRLITPRFVNE